MKSSHHYEPPMKIHSFLPKGCCNECCEIRRHTVPFVFYKVDCRTGAGLAGAVFELICRGEVVFTRRSGADGKVQFPPLQSGYYILKEKIPPEGYLKEEKEFCVIVDECGMIFVDGKPAKQFRVCNFPKSSGTVGSFTGIKYDVNTGARLAGAVFEMLSGTNRVARSVSNNDGSFAFNDLKPGTYSLVEVKAPKGYVPYSNEHTVLVNHDGQVTVDGFPADIVQIGNISILPGLQVLNLDENRNGLPGAKFCLNCGNTLVAEGETDQFGCIPFGTPAQGVYTLTQSKSAEGCRPYTAVHTVTVDDDGNLSIDGEPSGELVAQSVHL